MKRLLPMLILPLLLGGAEGAVPEGTRLVIELPVDSLATDVGVGGFVGLATYY